MRLLFLLLASITFFCSGVSFAQVNISYNNPKKIGAQGFFNKRYELKSHFVAAPSRERTMLKERQNESSADKQFLIAEPTAVNIDLVTAASWLNEGDASFGKFTIHADSAKTLSVNFDKFYLPQGTALYIYNKDGTMFMGPIGPSENNERRIWGSAIYKGEDLIIEVKIPAERKDSLSLHLSNIAYGYKQIFVDKAVGFGLSGPCNINVLCPLGATWANERNSVALITNADGSALCTGALIGNTCGTNIPYFLTANHCYAASPSVANWRFQFQAWSPTCSPNANSDGILFNGSTLKATYAPSDFTLVQLNQTPLPTSGLQYAGWNRNTAVATNTTGIHHPRGDVMKISADIHAPVKTPYLGSSGSSDHWQVTWDNGVTEGGSSGSPLFDQNHRIIGQLHGGYSACGSTDLRDWYGAFDVSWAGGGTNSTRLSNWLDPTNTGSTTWNIANISALGPYTGSSPGIDVSSTLCSGSMPATFTIDASIPFAGPVTWTSSDPAIATVTSTGNPATITKVGNGAVRISGSINATCPSRVETRFRDIVVGVPLTPTITYTKSTTTDYVFTASDWLVQNGHNWYINGTLIRSNADGVTYRTIPCYQTLTISCTSSNSCGTSALGSLYVRNGCDMYLVYPNPASSTVSVQTNSAQPLKMEKANLHPGIHTIKIFDNKGTLKKQLRLSAGNSTATIGVDDLIPGIYVIEISDGKNVEKQKLVISGR